MTFQSFQIQPIRLDGPCPNVAPAQPSVRCVKIPVERRTLQVLPERRSTERTIFAVVEQSFGVLRGHWQAGIPNRESLVNKNVGPGKAFCVDGEVGSF